MLAEPPHSRVQDDARKKIDDHFGELEPNLPIDINESEAEAIDSEADYQALIDRAKADNQIHAQQHEKKFRNLQLKLAPWIQWIAMGWLIITQIIVILIGCDILKYNESVIITYLTTTTANVLGLLLVVLYWLYKKR